MHQVYVYAVEDGRAGAWTAELAVRAESPAAAFRRLRDAGLRKRQFYGSARPARSASPADFPDVVLGPLGMARRALEDDGWEPWVPIPAGFAVNWRESGDVQLHHPVGGGFRRDQDRG